MAGTIWAIILIVVGILGTAFLSKIKPGEKRHSEDDEEYNDRCKAFKGMMFLFRALAIAVTAILAVVILFNSLVKEVKVNEAGIIVNSITRSTRSASLGYNIISPFERLTKVDATVVVLEYRTDKANDIWYGTQTGSGGYVTFDATVAVGIDRENYDKYVLIHGNKTIAELHKYIGEKMITAVKTAFIPHETSLLMKEEGVAASVLAAELLEVALKEDFITFKNLAVTDIEGDETYEAALALNEKIRQEIITAGLQKDKIEKENENALLSAQGKAAADLETSKGKAAADLEAAKGEAAAREEEARGEAEAIRLINEALASSQDALSMKQIEAFVEFIEAWDGKLPIISSGDSIQMFGFDINSYLKGTANNTVSETP